MTIEATDGKSIGGRPRKSDGEKIAPLMTGLPGDEYDAFCRLASDCDLKPAELAREYIREGMRRELSKMENRRA